MAVPLGTTTTVTVLSQGLDLSNGTIRAVSSSALSEYIVKKVSFTSVDECYLYKELNYVCVAEFFFSYSLSKYH
jgi:hypothetical protein